MNKVKIDRELLEQVASEFEHDNDRYMLGRELRKVLDAPCQPEGDDLDQRMKAAGMLSVAELLAGAPLDAFMKHAGVNDLSTFAQWLEMRRAECIRMHARYDLGECDKGDDLYEWTIAHAAVFNEVHVNFKAAHADAQRDIAELRDRLDVMTQCADNHSRMFEESAEELDAAREILAQQGRRNTELRAERDTLRQQLAERDAEIERLRVQLLAISSAEPGRHNIEWAKAMAATGNNEAYAKWREAFDQRDKLAGLLREVRVIVAREVERWTRSAAILPVNANVESGLLTRIDAALAGVKPCPESLHPAAT